MEKILRPERLDADPSSSEASKVWLHWKKTFQNFLATLDRSVDKLGVLTNYLSPNVYQFIEDCVDYDSATGQQHCKESIRDAFIAGLTSGLIRQRLLENKRLDLKTMFDQARSLESAARSSESFHVPSTSFNAAALPVEMPPDLSRDSPSVAAPAIRNQNCFFCGNGKHPWFKCPARYAVCSNCQKKEHFRKVCRSGASSSMERGHQLRCGPRWQQLRRLYHHY